MLYHGKIYPILIVIIVRFHIIGIEFLVIVSGSFIIAGHSKVVSIFFVKPRIH